MYFRDYARSKDRIKLAEAMGWKRIKLLGHSVVYQRGEVELPHKDACIRYSLPDPFTDANDDYAVLGWMREGGPNEAMDHLLFWHAQDYQIGDYARAALKVLNSRRAGQNEA